MHTIVIRLLAVFLMVSAGVVARRRKLVDGETTSRVVSLVMHIFYPALIYVTLVRTFTLEGLIENWALPAGAFLIMLTGFVVGFLLNLVLPLKSKGLKRAFHFQCTINNYVFLPMPLIMIYWGEAGVAMLVFSTIGSEIAVWTLGVVALNGGGVSLRQMAKRLLTMPMMAIAASVVTLLIRDGLGFTLSPESLFGEGGSALLDAMKMLGAAAPPLAMVVAGSRMAELHPKHLWQPIQLGVTVARLLVVPALALLVLRLLPLSGDPLSVLRVVAIMPAAIASVMLSDMYKADSEFAASAVLLTHVASLVTIPLWLTFLG
jgi:predicted permease